MEDSPSSLVIAQKMPTAVMGSQDHIKPGMPGMNGNVNRLDSTGNGTSSTDTDSPVAGLQSPLLKTPKKKGRKAGNTKNDKIVVQNTPTPKKRANPNTDSEVAADGSPTTLSNKKRATAKTKAKAKVEIEDGAVEHESENVNENVVIDQVPATPRTSSGQLKPKNKKQTPASSQKKATPARPIVTGTEIPKSYEEAGIADRLLWDMKASGATWDEIRVAYAEASGKPAGGKSSLPNRYDRLKANFTQIREEDIALFIKVKKAMEDEFEVKKWVQCADELEEEHKTPKYPAKALEKLFKKLEKEGRIKEGKLVDEADPDVSIAPEAAQLASAHKNKVKKAPDADE